MPSPSLQFVCGSILEFFKAQPNQSETQVREMQKSSYCHNALHTSITCEMNQTKAHDSNVLNSHSVRLTISEYLL